MDQIKLYSNTIKEIKNDIFNKNIHTNFKCLNNSLYQDSVSYEKRCLDSQRICAKYPLYVPIIVNCLDKDIKFKKNKYLAPKDIDFGKLIITIRSQIELDPSKAIFLFIDDMLFNQSENIGSIYENYKFKNKIKNNGDLYLYITINVENTFG